jgi:hypothetical protein
VVLRGVTFAERLRARIESEYTLGPWQLGWRLLYSPASVLDTAEVALIGLNPGGEGETDGHGVFAMTFGSAYVSECWGNARAGQSRLQRQVQQLSALLGVDPEQMLAGNLVPFRSPDFRRLPDPERAVRFGSDLWTDILREVRPRLIVTMSSVPEKVIARSLNARLVEAVPSGWGTVQLRRWKGDADIVALPHLSRYALFSHADCLEPLRHVLVGAVHGR